MNRTPPCSGAGPGPGLLGLPREVLLQVLAYLRAWDLAALGMTAEAFAQPQGAIEEVRCFGFGSWLGLVGLGVAWVTRLTRVRVFCALCIDAGGGWRA